MSRLPTIRGTGKADPADGSMTQISPQMDRRVYNSTPHSLAFLVPAQVALAAPSHGSPGFDPDLHSDSTDPVTLYARSQTDLHTALVTARQKST